ncbi:ComF family protein [Psychroserpens sp. XS_ASV72]|uniref:ComF family protein n=1 Tax=Psychroserpens sp. XS_ASV72 TaxID=3241293 RepID=UPI003514D979
MIINLLNLFFPKVCLSCQNYLTDNEVHICTSCRHQLPLTNFHFDNENAVHKMMYGRVKLEQATALLHFSKKGRVQRLMHNLKYKGQEVVGQVLGEWLGEELQASEQYKSVDVVVPVPIHPSKLRKRGYNQVAKFGKALAQALNAEYVDSVLLKSKSTATQVFKDRLTRSATVEEGFSLFKPEIIKGKHILLVDDIITTGSTLEACSQALLKAKDVKLSIATMAITD